MQEEKVSDGWNGVEMFWLPLKKSSVKLDCKGLGAQIQGFIHGSAQAVETSSEVLQSQEITTIAAWL